jgi:4-amino-4-deoxy-L-arabinose transferase-like glycosyltransferase
LLETDAALMPEALVRGARVERRPLVFLLAIGLGLRLAALPAVSGLDARILDEQDYLTLAASLADGRGFATAGGPTSLRPPLYPAFIAGVWTVTGTRSLQAVRVAQFGLALLTTLVVYVLARDLFGHRAALWGAAVACFYPSLLVSNYLALTEVLFALLIAMAIWASVRLVMTGSAWAAAAAGALFGLAALTRSVVYPFPLVMAVIVAIGVKASPVRRMVLAALLVVTAGAVLAPWAVRNTRLQGVPVLVDTMGGMNLRMGNYEHTPLSRMWDAVSMSGAKSWVIGLPSPPGGSQWSEGQKERWARSEAVSFMLAHPGLTLKRSLVKVGDFWALERDFIAGVEQGLYTPNPIVTVLVFGAITLSYPLVLFFALFGIARLRGGDWPAAWLPLVLVVFVCALHGLVFGHPRYRLPLMPLVGIYAGAALSSLSAPVRARQMHGRWPMFAVCGFVVLWLVQFAWRDWPYAERLLAGWRA